MQKQGGLCSMASLWKGLCPAPRPPHTSEPHCIPSRATATLAVPFPELSIQDTLPSSFLLAFPLGGTSRRLAGSRRVMPGCPFPVPPTCQVSRGQQGPAPDTNTASPPVPPDIGFCSVPCSSKLCPSPHLAYPLRGLKCAVHSGTPQCARLILT